jgi:hypothetical protein
MPSARSSRTRTSPCCSRVEDSRASRFAALAPALGCPCDRRCHAIFAPGFRFRCTRFRSLFYDDHDQGRLSPRTESTRTCSIWSTVPPARWSHLLLGRLRQQELMNWRSPPRMNSVSLFSASIWPFLGDATQIPTVRPVLGPCISQNALLKPRSENGYTRMSSRRDADGHGL